MSDPFLRSSGQPGGDAGGLQSIPSGPGTHRAPPGGADENIFLEENAPLQENITDGRPSTGKQDVAYPNTAGGVRTSFSMKLQVDSSSQ